MKTIIRLLPFIAGLGAGYVLAINIAGLDKTIQFVILSLFVLYLEYLFNLWNIKIMQIDMANQNSAPSVQEGESISKLFEGLYGYFGHPLVWISALTIGYGITVTNSMAIILGAGFWGLADDLLLKAKKKSLMDKRAALRCRKSKTINQHPAIPALANAIEEKRKTNPFVGPSLGAKALNCRLLEAMKDKKGVHIESLLCALGALAGYACQANLRAQARENGLPETATFNVIETSNGKKYFFGDALNQPLAESKYSIWSLAAGAAEHLGCKDFPDIREIFIHAIRTTGHADFGIPRLPDNHRASDTPINYLKALWPHVLPVIELFCPRPYEWPMLFGLAIQEAIEMGKDVLAPEIALKIVMESAIPMSKIDLDTA